MHTGIAGVWTVFPVSIGTRSSSKPAIHRFRPIPPLEVVAVCVAAISAYALYFLVVFSAIQYARWSPRTRQLIWQSVSSAEARDEMREICWVLIQNYEHWKSARIQYFYSLVRVHQRLFLAAGRVYLETWVTLSCVQKLFILAPAAIYYAYLYIVRHFI
ncbi:hypothetical protein DFH07DRAFT_799635 [Mycena maculata]|uniref:Uncharacterized protein n=1 Tax=Mycena maculata TaxID=230809 RepID=A0AAD7NTX6_9AGAR|nr:hypothetical protein DFH07DRAFT_799635 [Mycena maculata]